MTRRYVGLFVMLVSIHSPFASSALAQIVIPPRPPAGVFIDADGVLRSRQVNSNPSKKRPSREGEKRSEKTIGLREALDRAKKEQASGKPSSVESRIIGGLLRVERITVDEEKKEIYLTGPVEDLDLSDPVRPAGKVSGRPALRLDDFVVALRKVGPGQKSRPLGCSIDLPADVNARLTRAAEPLIAMQNYQPDVIVRTMQDAIGNQKVRFFDLEADTPFALVCLTADVGLKRLALGLDVSPIKKIKSHLSMAKEREAVYNRWWFIADYQPIGVSEDGRIYQLSGPRLKVLASDSPTQRSNASPAAQKFADMLNEHMEPLCEQLPSFADLQNVTDLAVVAALIASDDLHRKIDWDVAAEIADYVVPTVPPVTEVEPMVNFVQRSRAIQVSTGGVQLNVDGVVHERHKGLIDEPTHVEPGGSKRNSQERNRSGREKRSRESKRSENNENDPRH